MILKLTRPISAILIVTALLMLPFPVNHAAEESPNTTDQATDEMKQEYISKGYFVGDLITTPFPPSGFTEDDLPRLEAVIILIWATSPPEMWNKETTITPYINSGTLVIMQTELAHEQIAELLANLRKDRNIPGTHRLKRGDVLEIFIETITGVYRRLGSTDQIPSESTYPHPIAYTIPVRDDGTISLPKMMHSLNVEGMTQMETQSLLRHAYVNVLKILGPDAIITVSLISPRSALIPEPILALLEKHFPCDFGAEVPLQTVLDDIHKKTGISFVIHGDAIKSQEMTVQARLPFHLPLKNFLDYLVRQHDLSWHYQDDAIHITDKDSDPDMKIVDRVYCITGLVRPAGINPSGNMPDLGDMKAITAYIQTMVAPESWNEEVTIWPDFNEPLLIIRQTERVHAQIADLLINLWKARCFYKPYNVKDLVTDNDDIKALITRIKETVTPDNWGKSVFISAVEDYLYITHNPTGHERINDLLRQWRAEKSKEQP